MVKLAGVRSWCYSASILTPAHRGRGLCFLGTSASNELFDAGFPFLVGRVTACRLAKAVEHLFKLAVVA
jgi:hypothetical protein